MNSKNTQIAGLVLHLLVGGLMIFAGSGKAFGFAPPDIIQKMTTYGLKEQVQLIGYGEIIAALLMLIPRTSPLGVLATSGFWGGVICIHMAHHEDYIFPSVLLAVTWIAASLRGSIHLRFPVIPAEPTDV